MALAEVFVLHVLHVRFFALGSCQKETPITKFFIMDFVIKVFDCTYHYVELHDGDVS